MILLIIYDFIINKDWLLPIIQKMRFNSIYSLMNNNV